MKRLLPLLVLTVLTAFLHAAEPAPPVATRNKKGLQSVVDIDDALKLGISHTAINVSLPHLLQRGKSHIVHSSDGYPIPIRGDSLAQLDLQVKRFTTAGVRVYFIVLNLLPADATVDDAMIHPATDLKQAPNRIGAFNTTTTEGVRLFRGLLEFLAARYSRPDLAYGRATDFIIGNEVQSHWHWYNLGEMKAEDVIADYHRTLRHADEAVRRMNPAARVYISLDHFWSAAHQPNHPTRTMPGRQFIDELTKLSRSSGDFPWQVAFHPYPENLRDPRTWNDATAKSDPASPRITFKNLQVLTAYLRQPELLHAGEPRRVILSEQGFDLPAGPDGEKLQAAGFAYAYEKVRHLQGVDAFILHRHVDHPGEGGLRLGLRAHGPRGAHDPAAPRLIYRVFEAAETPGWYDAIEFARPLIGIKDWAEVR